MLKHLLVLPLLLLISFSLKAQFDTSFAQKNIIRCADSLTDAFKSKDWEKFTRYSYPAMIGTIGGKDQFIRYISQTFMQIPDTAWKKYETGKVLQLVKTDRDIQGLIELHSVVEWQGTRITSTSCLVGESWDGGLFWTFFDSQGDITAAKTIDPALSNQLIIPAKNEKTESLTN